MIVSLHSRLHNSELLPLKNKVIKNNFNIIYLLCINYIQKLYINLYIHIQKYIIFIFLYYINMFNLYILYIFNIYLTYTEIKVIKFSFKIRF